MGKVEHFDAVEISADMATKQLVTDRLRTYASKEKHPGEYSPGCTDFIVPT